MIAPSTAAKSSGSDCEGTVPVEPAAVKRLASSFERLPREGPLKSAWNGPGSFTWTVEPNAELNPRDRVLTAVAAVAETAVGVLVAVVLPLGIRPSSACRTEVASAEYKALSWAPMVVRVEEEPPLPVVMLLLKPPPLV